MIDPDNLTKFDRTPAELEELALFCVMVAGKPAHATAQRLHRMLTMYVPRTQFSSPFAYMWWLQAHGILHRTLEQHRFGQYNRLYRAIHRLVMIPDLTRVSVADLTAIMGPKSARLFVLHSRPGARVAAIDTHILKFLAERVEAAGVHGIVRTFADNLGIKRVPKSTPAGRAYLKLEALFLAVCEVDRRVPAEYDLEIWKRYRVPRKESVA